MHTAACFIRVDIRVNGTSSGEVYDALSERLQDLLQEAVLAPADGGAEMDLEGMTCLVLGPVSDDETIEANREYADNFAPVAKWLKYASDEEA